jgi:hypothetical protein
LTGRLPLTGIGELWDEPWRCDYRNAVTLADRGVEHVGDEEADGLRLPILVGACGAFVACSAIRRRSSKLTGRDVASAVRLRELAEDKSPLISLASPL